METEQEKINRKQNRRSPVLVGIILLAIIVSVGISFYRYFILRDYIIQAQIECDPYTEACFVYHCDETVEECTGDTTADTSFYKLVDRSARYIPSCNPSDERCNPFACSESEEECKETFCDPQNVDGIECTNPRDYYLDNPMNDAGQIEINSVDEIDAPATGLEELPAREN